MERETLSPSSSSSNHLDFPPEDAWIVSYRRLFPQWQSFPQSSQRAIAWCNGLGFSLPVEGHGLKCWKWPPLWRVRLFTDHHYLYPAGETGTGRVGNCNFDNLSSIRKLFNATSYCIQAHPSNTQVPIPVSISRVNQFDAARLDVEISAMLKEQLVKVFSLMKPGLLFQYEPELDAFLEFLIWRFSIWVDKPTPGNALMNLRYRDERAVMMRGKQVRTGLEGPGLTVPQKIWYCLAMVGGQYIWARLQSFSAFRRWGDSEQRSFARWVWVFVQRVEGFYKAASFSNLLIFLYTGSYRTLIERALRARLVYGSPNMNRAVSFEYMNRQLVWNEFSEMLLLLVPLLNSSFIKKFLLPFSKDKSSGSSADETTCPVCQANPTIPFVALPCQHRYCYYCLRTRCTAGPSFRCVRCNEFLCMQTALCKRNQGSKDWHGCPIGHLEANGSGSRHLN